MKIFANLKKWSVAALAVASAPLCALAEGEGGGGGINTDIANTFLNDAAQSVSDFFSTNSTTFTSLMGIGIGLMLAFVVLKLIKRITNRA